MRDIDHGDSQVLVQRLDFILHVFAQLLVERAQRLVHQHQLGVEHQRPGQRDALLLAARKLRRAAVLELAHLHHVERAGDPALALGLAHPAHLEREGEVLAHRHVREQGVALEHHADAALVWRDVVDVLAVQTDLAVGRGLEAGEHHQAGRLARPGRPEHRQELALADVQIEVLHHKGLAVIAFLDMVEDDETVAPGRRRTHAPLLGRSDAVRD